jgi:hypothetical protein
MALRLDQMPWTPEEDATLARLTAQGATALEVCQALPHRPVGGIENRRRKLGLKSPINGRPKGYSVDALRPVAEYRGPDPDIAPLAEVFAPDASRDETDDELLARILPHAARSVAKAEAQKHVTLRIPSDVPIALCISSDWHVSTTGTDLDGLLKLADLVAATPGLYSIAVGDLFDNPIKHRGGSVGVVSDELRLLDIIVKRYKGKLMGTTSGNHDDWSKVMSGIDALRTLAMRHRIHYAPDELLWKVQIVAPHDMETVTAEYLIATRHQWRRHSNLNPTHACKTWMQEQQMNWETIPDVLAIGHNHVAAIGSEQFAGRDVHFLRMGSFQRDSAYARAKGFADYRPTAPTVVLPPTRAQRIACFPDPQDAVQHLRGWRDVAA